jgi:hypothetical protein
MEDGAWRSATKLNFSPVLSPSPRKPAARCGQMRLACAPGRAASGRRLAAFPNLWTLAASRVNAPASWRAASLPPLSRPRRRSELEV